MTERDSDDATAQPSDQSTGGFDGDADRTAPSPTSEGRSADGGMTADSGRDAAGSGGPVDGRDIVGYVQWAAFAILCLLALVATFRFYFAASEAIRVWFSPDFVPVFQAVFNLVVLAASAIGISVLVRRIA